MKKKYVYLLLILLPCTSDAFSQGFVTNLKEDSIPSYVIPDPLRLPGRRLVSTSKQWTKSQRPYIYSLFKENVYGGMPTNNIKARYIISETGPALNGLAIRKQVRIYFQSREKAPFVDLILFVPASAKNPVPVFLGYNFSGNHTINEDKDIFLTSSWLPTRGRFVVNNRATDSSRGIDSSSWPLREILLKGYGVATAYYGDIEPDHPEGWQTGIRSSMEKELAIAPEQWSAIGAWAWGLSRMLDYLKTDKTVNGNKVFVIGHSRLGKAALWAGASDERFAMIISNESGEGGAALSKRFYGETVRAINERFPHWFASRYKFYNDNTDSLPVDQHMLLALLAPRPLYVASAEGDQWSDPKGEFLGAKYASPVYALFNKKGIDTDSMPALHHPVGETIRYHIRAGKHNINDYDWAQYLDFADRMFPKKVK